jgi:cytochrome c-type biogenesis protein CcmH
MAILLVLLGAPAVSSAEQDTSAASYSVDLFTQLMSPYCPGRTLMDCPSSQAAELRSWITEQEQAGRSRSDVEEQLYEQFGDVILQAPRAQGFGLAAYLLPVVAVLVGGAIVWLFLRRQAGGAGGATVGSPTPVVLDPEIERRIDEELRA